MFASLIALAASVGVLSPVGVAQAAEENDAVNSALQGGYKYKLEVSASTSRIALTDGKRGPFQGDLTKMNEEVEGPQQELFEIQSPYNKREAEFKYRVSILGKKTPYWVKIFANGRSSYKSECTFYDGDPWKGGTRVDVAPFNCRYTRTDTDPYAVQYHFDFDLNRWAEASGKITTQEVSLTKGTFRSDLPYSVAGVTEMAPFQYTSFEAVMREGDTSFFENQARTEFSYQIAVDGKATGFWAAGMSTNWRGPVAFNGDGRCAIYDHDPLLGGGRLDKTTPIISKDYFCKAEGGYIRGRLADGNVHYNTDFTVGRIWH